MDPHDSSLMEKMDELASIKMLTNKVTPKVCATFKAD
jgi:hypothetical protein